MLQKTKKLGYKFNNSQPEIVSNCSLDLTELETYSLKNKWYFQREVSNDTNIHIINTAIL